MYEANPQRQEPEASGAQNGSALRSVHTSNFPEILDRLGVSLLVSTYQAGKVVIVRGDGGRLNTHFRDFAKPMGMAVTGGRLGLGTATQVCELHNVPAAARRLEPTGKHDACFLPRAAHVTGDIDVHEMAWVGAGPNARPAAGDQLWIVNTKFSCLCTLDREHSFVPRWRPPFVSALAPEDRCHLNGLGLVDGRPKYATALGTTDTAAGWRENKAAGGILMDIESNEVLAEGLSMPHSPRRYGGKLWLLESGAGNFSVVEERSPKPRCVAELPGFPRGLDFFGPLAFVGLSQVRETAVFSGIPITARLTERNCGVWVVDITSGDVIAFLKFEEGVQEVFSVVVLPGMRYPEVLNDDPIIATSYVLPDAALCDVPRALAA